MKNSYLTKMFFALLLGLFGFANANAAFLNNPEKVDIVQISTWMTPNNTKWEGGKPYIAVDGTNVVHSADVGADNTKWYEIPAGSNDFGQQAYYYKNVATGAYLQGSTRAPGSGGDWTVSAATVSVTNDKTNLFKWSKMGSNWTDEGVNANRVWLVNEEGNTGARPSGDNKNAFFALTSLTLNSEFFGADLPNAAVSNPHDGGNAWTAVQILVAETGVSNPDYIPNNPEKVAIVQISTWMTPNNTKWEGGKPYIAVDGTNVVHSADAGADNTKWYEIPAGSNDFGQQAYYYKNVATGAYLQGSTRAPGSGGDWTVSAATVSETNGKTNLFKWSKMGSNWTDGGVNANRVWLVNEEGNTGARPSGDNKNAFFALTSLTLNSEFFGADLPNAAVSNPHDGGNAWTAVQILVAEENALNPDYVPNNPAKVDVVQISTWMTPNNTKWEGGKPYIAVDGTNVVHSADAGADNTKWYEIPAGSNDFGQQAYYYKNVATGAYLQGSTRAPGSGGDWTVSAATVSETNGKTNLFKWSKMGSNWTDGGVNANRVWLVNEEGNTGARPSGDNKNAFFALTSLTLNSEFFGADLPNAAVSNPHDGGNAWTAVQILVAETGVSNPDYDGPVLELELSLDDVIVWGGDPANTYNKTTRTITFNADWNGGAKWDVSGLDLSAYNRVTVEFENAAGGYVRLNSEYSEGTEVEVGANDPQALTNRLDVTRIDKLIAITLGVNNANARQVVLKKAYFWYEDALKYSINKLNFFENSSYDEKTHIATYNGGWQRVGWNFEAQGGLDIPAGNDQIFLEFDATTLSNKEGNPANPADIKLQFDVEYMDGTSTTAGGGHAGGNEYRANATQAWWNLDAGKKIKQITLKSEKPGNITLTKAYFFTRPDDPVDLIVTAVRWEPANPAPGDDMKFFATIQNTSEDFSSPENRSHGVAFKINGVTVLWSDDFMGPLGPGETMEVETNGGDALAGASPGGVWVCGANKQYTITAHVNDGKRVKETNSDNNTLDATLTVEGEVDLEVTAVDWVENRNGYQFSMKVKNVGTINAPATDKGVKFYVNGELATWYEKYTGPINAGSAEIFITADSNKDGLSATRYSYWAAPGNGLYTIKAEINGDKSIAESNYANNVVEKALQIGTSNIDYISTDGGNVYVNNSVLYLVNYPSASVSIYSLLGQQVANLGTITDNVNVDLASGSYIVKVQFEGKAFTHKVFVK